MAGKKADLSKFIERAVQKEVLRATIRDIQERNAHVRALTRPASAGRLVDQRRADAEFVDRSPTIQRSDDPADDFLPGICEAGDADYLVTGDKAGLLARAYGPVTAREFPNLPTSP